MRTAFLPVTLAVLSFAATSAPPAAAQISPCPAQGLTLAFTGGTLGSFAKIAVGGMPGSVAFVGIDAAGGPIPLPPFGTLCLGFTGAFGIFAVPLGAAGQGQLSAIVALDASLTGAVIYAQAAAVDLAQPSGLALSNGGSLELRPPRYYLIDHGSIGPFPGPPGHFSAFEPMAIAFDPPVTLAGRVRAALRVPALGRIALMLDTGVLQSLDEDTGAQVQAIPLPTSPGAAIALAPALAPDEILVLYAGQPPSPFGGGSPGALRRVSLAGAGSVVATIALASGNPTDILAPSGSPVVWLPAGGTLCSIDLASGQELAPLTLPTGFGSAVDWVLGANRLYALHGGEPFSIFGGTAAPGAITAVDLAAHAVVGSSAPFALTDPPSAIRLGPSPSAQSLHVLFPTAGVVERFHPTTLAAQGQVFLPAPATMMELSAGGTEWLLVGNGGSALGAPLPGNLMRLAVGASTAQLVASLPADSFDDLTVLPSAFLHTAMLSSGDDSLLYLATDPAGGFVTIPSPFGSSTGLMLLTN